MTKLTIIIDLEVSNYLEISKMTKLTIIIDLESE